MSSSEIFTQHAKCYTKLFINLFTPDEAVIVLLTEETICMKSQSLFSGK